MTSGERGQNVTLIASINAIGNHIPPMMIFPKVNFKPHLIKGGPIGTIGGANPSGWSDKRLFLEYLELFKNHVKPTVEYPIILLLDNQSSHVNVNAINFCKNNGILMITFHPHTSHKMQPLDRTVFGPMKTYYNTACSEWMIMNPGQPITIFDIAELAGKAFPKAFTVSNIQKGFEVSGLYPVNENIFEEHDFLSAYVTDRPINQTIDGHEQINDEQQEEEQGKTTATAMDDPAPSTSNVLHGEAAKSSITPEMFIQRHLLIY